MAGRVYGAAWCKLSAHGLHDADATQWLDVGLMIGATEFTMVLALRRWTDNLGYGLPGEVTVWSLAGGGYHGGNADHVIAQVLRQMNDFIELYRQAQWARIIQLDREIGEIEDRIKLWHRSSCASQRVAEIPGVGLLTATAVVSAMGDPAAFRSGREFAAWLGLVPRHKGTGGRVRVLGISKRGDKYLRTLLIHGARAVLSRSKVPPKWAVRLAARRPPNVVTVALANKTARTIWALLAYNRMYQANFVSQPA